MEILIEKFKIQKNKHGYFEVTNKPNSQELQDFYEKKYYQNEHGSYELDYSDEEVAFFKNQINERFELASDLLGSQTNKNFLDIGAGEGWALEFFNNKGWDVLGIDFSDFGLLKFHPHLHKKFYKGEVLDILKGIIKQEKKFSIIWLDNVLEHVISPEEMLQLIHKLLDKDGVLIIDVPNDFSILQEKLYEMKKIKNRFWLAPPEHLSYFSRDGLVNLLSACGFTEKISISDFPIDFYLSNETSNYVENKSLGKPAHKSRIFLENLMFEISPKDRVNFHKSLANMGLGRSIVSFFQV